MTAQEEVARIIRCIHPDIVQETAMVVAEDILSTLATLEEDVR